LQWQWDFQGARLQNLRLLVCDSCNDKPFQQNRTIILPPDPMPIMNPRPELYTSDDNPITEINWDPLALTVAALPLGRNGNIGNMTGGAGVDAPFGPTAAYQWPVNGYSFTPPSEIFTSKRAAYSAFLNPSINGAQNWVGKNWAAYGGAPPNVPTQLNIISDQFGVNEVVLIAPSDMPFLQSGGTIVEFDGWNGGAWQSIWSGTTAGTVGEQLTISSSMMNTTAPFYAHRALFTGDGVHAIAVAAMAIYATGAATQVTAPASNALTDSKGNQMTDSLGIRLVT
jgi:hypothetical protein